MRGVTHANDPVAAMPVSAIFGFLFGARDEHQATVELPLRPEFLQGEARVHGGILATLADTSAVYLLISGLPLGRTLTSIEFKLNFVRPALLERGAVAARARLVKRGRQVALVDVELEQQGELVAKGLFTYLLADRAPPPLHAQ